jgi:hypothetical protein
VSGRHADTSHPVAQIVNGYTVRGDPRSVRSIFGDPPREEYARWREYGRLAVRLMLYTDR